MMKKIILILIMLTLSFAAIAAEEKIAQEIPKGKLKRVKGDYIEIFTGDIQIAKVNSKLKSIYTLIYDEEYHVLSCLPLEELEYYLCSPGEIKEKYRGKKLSKRNRIDTVVNGTADPDALIYMYPEIKDKRLTLFFVPFAECPDLKDCDFRPFETYEYIR